MRTVIWFSAGATSAVAARLALTEYPDAEIVRIRIDSEHPDSDRFSDDVEKWLGKPIITLTPKRKNHWNVLAYHRYLNGPTGAKCTRELKRDMRVSYTQPDDLQVFGFDADEKERVEDFRERNPEINFVAPLLDAGLTKSECHSILMKAGIAPHAMYLLGYDHANCVGCVKGGMGYWNKIRKDFPDVFDRMAKLERDIGASCLKDKNGRVFLDTLDPNRGNMKTEPKIDCGIFCYNPQEATA